MLLCLLQVSQALFELAIINGEELIRCGGHVDIVRLSLYLLFIKKTIYRIVLRGILEQRCHDLK